MEFDEYCVCCGEYTPEGRQICYECERLLEENSPKTDVINNKNGGIKWIFYY